MSTASHTHRQKLSFLPCVYACEHRVRATFVLLSPDVAELCERTARLLARSPGLPETATLVGPLALDLPYAVDSHFPVGSTHSRASFRQGGALGWREVEGGVGLVVP